MIFTGESMKSLMLAVVLMVVGAQAQAESKSNSGDLEPKCIREYK